jgi:alpha-D-ribose 1-methylphosphonate 5-triphosphate synthase subunit PhnH
MTATEAQQAFRAILEALARPARPFKVNGPGTQPPPLSSTAAAIALALCDEDTPVWLDAELTKSKAWFAFYTGAPVVTDPAAASFVFATGFDRLPPLDELAAGTAEQPHRSATVVLENTGEKVSLRAEGPGLPTYAEIALPSGFCAAWQRNTARFPRGVDMLLVEGDTVRGLPRTTRLEGVS